MEQQTLTEITTLTISKLISVIQNKYFITGAIVGGCFIYQYVSPKSFGTLSNKETTFQLLKDSSNNNDDEERKIYNNLIASLVGENGKLLNNKKSYLFCI